ncbi:MAG: UDP-N-acetylmuramoyl-L-alanyl-D-glutamate--2,6-diaminopimelate ligase [Dissulfurimicrobium sp.]|uniref:UDP-N-acetylmuramoyl-L-alanyl-D-glutamate--2, 6-diaminopimelate ligase n=1 Tax=Dissulfurimicrobium sp. TaxID=2022436 RepID=UPI003D0A4E64
MRDKEILAILDDAAGVTCNSKKVRPGFVFVAMPGTKRDGLNFVADAIKNGAGVVVTSHEGACRLKGLNRGGVKIFGVDDPRSVFARLASIFYGEPSKGLIVVGVTGTNGKTTVTYLLESIFREADLNPGVIGTISMRYAGMETASELTTPDSAAIQACLAEMLRGGVKAVAMEVSSHAIDQKRVEGCEFKVAVFTNLTRDHLDYHHDMEAYFLTKARLFTEYKVGLSVINLDDPYGLRLWAMIDGSGNRRISYGFDRSADIWPESFESSLAGLKARISTPFGEIDIKSRLIGRHNLSNILGAIGAAAGLGIDLNIVRRGIECLDKVPGRLEPVAIHQRDITALVDYAHTPDALENVLKTLSNLAIGRIICVVGCGGDRDQGKRPIMARIAARYSDIAVFTSDNPRGEDPAFILNQMLQGLAEIPAGERDGYSAHVEVIPDRREAIFWAAARAETGDCVLVAGKGHETYQIIGDERIYFDDREVLREAFGPRISLCQVASAIGAEVVYGKGSNGVSVQLEKVLIGGISTDTRSILPKDLFWAFKGGRFDGRDFVCEAIKKGACGAIVSHEDMSLLKDVSTDAPLLAVHDVLNAFGDLASWYRKRLGLGVFAITGSCGKTTTKEAIASIFQKRWRVVKTKGNFNNLIGLPLSLFEAREGDDWAVLEMGMNRPGEIARLVEIAGPDAALITNIRPVHLEGLGDLEGVAREKGEVFKALGKDGTAVVNLDDPLVLEVSRAIDCRKVFYSVTGGSRGGGRPDVFLVSWSPLDAAFYIEIDIAGHLVRSDIPLIGTANVQNVVAAAAAAYAIGLTDDEITAGLQEMKGLHGRMGLEDLGCDFYLIDDSYNANPASMAMALETLSVWGRGKKIAILGDMLELGKRSVSFHQDLGRKAGLSGVDLLVSMGEFSTVVAEEARKAGVEAFAFDDMDALMHWLSSCLDRRGAGIFSCPCTILVKGSRGVRCDRVSGVIRAAFAKERGVS